MYLYPFRSSWDPGGPYSLQEFLVGISFAIVLNCAFLVAKIKQNYYRLVTSVGNFTALNMALNLMVLCRRTQALARLMTRSTPFSVKRSRGNM